MTPYASTRGGAPDTDFTGAMMGGLAADGGLYVPASWPRLPDLSALRGAPFGTVAGAVLGALGASEAQCKTARTAYGAFAHPALAPLVQLGPDDWLLELHHGPTLAFKDVAMQALGRLFAAELAARGSRMSVVCATSGDTGGAAAAALAGQPNLTLTILYPEGRISEVQRRFMTTTGAPNVQCLAVDGNFDDCQRIVKALFADEGFRDEVALTAVNSINWARIAAQASYYVAASLALSAAGPVAFSVPTGNFGDAFAGIVAQRLGAPVGRIVVATNENDVLDRTMRTGAARPRPVVATQSPSMDIQVASNFERMIWEASRRDAALTADLMQRQNRGEAYELPEAVRTRIDTEIETHAVTGDETREEMKRSFAETGSLLCPHTAIGRVGARRARAAGLRGPIVTLATAHAAKFPDAVRAATGVTPPLPPRRTDLFAAEERIVPLAADTEAAARAIRALAAHALAV